MSEFATSLLQQALTLNADERHELGQQLLDSLEDDDLPDDPAWRAELDRRLQSVADGTAEIVPWEQAREAMQAELQRRAELRAGKPS